MIIDRSVSQTYVQRIVGYKGWVGLMEHAGFKARLMKAPKLKDTGSAHGLPPGEPVPIFPIATLPGAPADWVKSPGTYVCPVISNVGLWFDWTMNDEMNTAIIPSVKGLNPITGLKMEGPQLEAYIDKCPRHKEPFTHGRFCEKCGYEWAPQNYVCESPLWWDGWRTGDGKIRQFFFTEDEERDIASLVIGKENVVPAFGFVFYKTKTRRNAPSMNIHYNNWNNHVYGSGFIGSDDTKGYSGKDYQKKYMSPPATWINGTTPISNSGDYMYNPDDVKVTCNNAAPNSTFACMPQNTNGQQTNSSKGIMRSRSMKSVVVAAAVVPDNDIVKSVAVGAGAEISQNLAADPLGIEGWCEKPAAIIRLYFVFEKQFKEIASKGIKELTAEKEGYLKNLPVG